VSFKHCALATSPSLPPSRMTPDRLSLPPPLPIISGVTVQAHSKSRSDKVLTFSVLWLSPVFAVKVNHKHDQVNSGSNHTGGQREGLCQMAEKQETIGLKIYVPILRWPVTC
jgi:hypothetical protein